MNKNNSYSIFLILSVILFSCGCSESIVGSSTEELQETFIGNSLELVELDSLNTARKLVPVSPDKAYSIDSRVGIEGDYYVFNLYTPHGTYLIKGVAGLVEHATEAEIIEMILGANYGQSISPVLQSALDFTNSEVVDIKAYKIDSIKGLGRRFNELYNEDVNETIVFDDIQNRDAVNGASYNQKRMLLARKLGLDAYSASVFVQKFLDSMLSLPSADIAAFDEVDLVYPFGESVVSLSGKSNIDASMQSVALVGGGRNKVLEQKLITLSPAQIRNQVYNAFMTMLRGMDISDTLIVKLVNSPYYSSREILYLFAYLNDMKETSGRKEAVDFLAGADSSFIAKENFLQLQLMHAYYVASGGIRKIIVLANMLGFIDISGQVMVIPVWDHTRDRIAVRKLLIEVKNLKERLGLSQAAVWFAGDCDKNTIKTAGKAGIQVKKGIVLEPAFRFTNYRRLTYFYQSGDPLIENVVSLTSNSFIKHQRINRVVPTQLLPENTQISAGKKEEEVTITIEDPDKPEKLEHDPRNLHEFGFGVKIIPKKEWEARNSGSGLQDESVDSAEPLDNPADSETDFVPIKESDI